MIKAVFFDWFNTLSRFEPPREELHSQTYREFGFELPPEKLLRGLLMADKDWFEEDVKSRVQVRSGEDQLRQALRYQNTVLREAGVEASNSVLLEIVKRMQQLYQGLTFVLFDDVLPTLKKLRKRQLVLGLISNATTDMTATYRKQGLEPCLDFIVTSKEVKANKPSPVAAEAAEKPSGKPKQVNSIADIEMGTMTSFDAIGLVGKIFKEETLENFRDQEKARRGGARKTVIAALDAQLAVMRTDITKAADPKVNMS